MTILSDWATYWPTLLTGLGVSLRLTAISLVIGLPLGLLLAVATGSRHRAVRWLTVGLVEVGRGAPALVVLYMVYFGLGQVHVLLSAFLSAAIAFTWTTGAYTSEMIRAGLQSVPDGVVEASHALGMSARDTLRFVTVPVGMRVAIPSLMGFAILIFQGTSLAYSISVQELVSQVYSIASVDFNYLSLLLLAGLMYAVISVPATWLTVLVERRMALATA